MFKKRTPEDENSSVDSSRKNPMENSTENASNKPVEKKMESGKVNTILKGSKLKGDINISCDLELSGDVEGNITSKENSNIFIKGTCKGNIDGGNVNIDGELLGGNITARNDVRISGKFIGGEVKATNRIYVNGEFKGKLEANEIEIGSNARGEGELFYKEFISVAKGAKLEAKISQSRQELKLVKDSPKKQPVDVELSEKAAGEVKE